MQAKTNSYENHQRHTYQYLRLVNAHGAYINCITSQTVLGLGMGGES